MSRSLIICLNSVSSVVLIQPGFCWTSSTDLCKVTLPHVQRHKSCQRRWQCFTLAGFKSTLAEENSSFSKSSSSSLSVTHVESWQTVGQSNLNCIKLFPNITQTQLTVSQPQRRHRVAFFLLILYDDVYSFLIWLKGPLNTTALFNIEQKLLCVCVSASMATWLSSVQ